MDSVLVMASALGSAIGITHRRDGTRSATGVAGHFGASCPPIDPRGDMVPGWEALSFYAGLPMLTQYILFQEAGMFGALRLLGGDPGQTMAEYAIVLGVITIAVVVTLGLLNAAILNLLNSVIPLI